MAEKEENRSKRKHIRARYTDVVCVCVCVCVYGARVRAGVLISWAGPAASKRHWLGRALRSAQRRGKAIGKGGLEGFRKGGEERERGTDRFRFSIDDLCSGNLHSPSVQSPIVFCHLAV